jgi:hypothetical protein
MLIEMLKDQNYPDLHTITPKSLPKIGYIALLGKRPIAAGFLRKVEGNIVAQLDGLTSNPYFGSKIRHIAITKIVEQLIEDAKDLKLQGIIAFTTDDTVIKRAQSIGFVSISHKLIALNLI